MPPRARLTRQQQDALVRAYTVEGRSIRELTASTGWSYGFVHRRLQELGVQLRARGGDHRKARRRVEEAVSDHVPVTATSSLDE